MGASSLDVPFYANPDSTHCFQAALRMVVKCFAREGRSYLVEFFGAEFVGASPLPPDLSPDQAAAASFVDTVACETRIPDLDDLRHLLADGYLAICNVNSRNLNEREGYMGHFVVVTSCDANELVLHDPGPPATPRRRVAIGAFEKAWAYPTERAKNIVAVRPRSPGG